MPVTSMYNTSVLAVIAISIACGSALGAAAVPDLSGTYWAATYSPKIQVMGGGDPPLNDAGKAAYAMNQTGLRNGTLPDVARKV